MHVHEFWWHHNHQTYNRFTLVGQLAIKLEKLVPEAMVYRPLAGPASLRPHPTDVTVPLCLVSESWANTCSTLLRVCCA